MTSVETAGSPPATGVPRLPPLTLADELLRLAPGWDVEELFRWPPDAFAVTASVLADSGAYRCVVDPPAGGQWPPSPTTVRGWQTELKEAAGAWAEWAAQDSLAAGAVPKPVARLRESLTAAGTVPLRELDQPQRWQMLTDLLHLHALADEASAGAGLLSETGFQRRAAGLLAASGSLARLPRDRASILPKLRPPASGITMRSLSHHLALDRSEVEARWLVAPPAERAVRTPDRLTLLLIPHPAAIRSSDFRSVAGSLANMDDSHYGFYEYAPQAPFDVEATIRLTEQARHHIGAIDVLVLPEAALDESEVPVLQKRLAEGGVPYLIAGVRRQASESGSFGGNYAHFGARDWQAPPQHKHHRWCLDASQVHQYHLGAALDPRRRWWEAIDLPRRCLTFATIFEQLTICPLVCEDLARPDPVTDVIRSIAPTLVVGLLLDGPQLPARWPARYGSVLADDPGCSVLTLTALGMAQRSQPPGCDPSRAIALWKDPHRGLQQITLADGAHAVALTAHTHDVRASSADGRTGKRVAELVLSGIEQIE